VLARAFANRYEVDLISNVELVIRSDTGYERRRRFRAVSKVIEDRVHSIGRLVWPEHLRGMTILTIEAQNRSHDAFVYLPSLGKVRRVTSAQRGDSFFGTDVTYEDLERRRVEEYELRPLEMGVVDGEDVYLVRGRPRGAINYDRIVFAVSRLDGAILETRYFKRNREHPYRVIWAPRSKMVEVDGHVFPTRLTVRNHDRATTTEVTFENLSINPEISDHVFSIGTLEQGRKLPSVGD
jgi:hypothetical protein